MAHLCIGWRTTFPNLPPPSHYWTGLDIGPASLVNSTYLDHPAQPATIQTWWWAFPTHSRRMMNRRGLQPLPYPRARSIPPPPPYRPIIPYLAVWTLRWFFPMPCAQPDLVVPRTQPQPQAPCLPQSLLTPPGLPPGGRPPYCTCLPARIVDCCSPFPL